MQTTDEDIENLKLGKDFNNASTLSIAEIDLILQVKTNESSYKTNPIFEKTYDYVKRFNQFSKKEEVMQIRSVFENSKLTDFECSALWNLCPENVEEAKALIPSLKRLENDEELQTLLNDLASYRTNKAQPLFNK